MISVHVHWVKVGNYETGSTKLLISPDRLWSCCFVGGWVCRDGYLEEGCVWVLEDGQPVSHGLHDPDLLDGQPVPRRSLPCTDLQQLYSFKVIILWEKKLNLARVGNLSKLTKIYFFVFLVIFLALSFSYLVVPYNFMKFQVLWSSRWFQKFVVIQFC